MKARIIIITCILAMVVCSCIPGLYPLYTEKDLRFDNRLLGKWLSDKDANGTDKWTFEWVDTSKTGGVFMGLKDEWSDFKSGKTYRLTALEDSSEQKFAVHLLEIDNNLYLDFYPVDWEVAHDFLMWHLIPAHIFARIEIGNDMIILHFFNPEFLENLINQNKIMITHVRLDYTYLITAETDELQKFVRKYGIRTEAYVEADTLVRMNSVLSL